MSGTTTRHPSRPLGENARGRGGAALVALIAVVWFLGSAIIHISQGTAAIDVTTLWRAATGADLEQATMVLLESRLPRFFAAILVGTALGMAGAAMQSITRNPLASPDTTGVGAGAFLALMIVTVLGVPLGLYASLGVTFAGGAVTALFVIGLSRGSGMSPAFLVLTGSVITLGLGSISSALLLLFPWGTQGLFAWGSGSLSQNGTQALQAAAPIIVVAALVLIGLGRRLDLLQMGEDTAASLGVPVVSTRLSTVALAVLLTAASITIAGPIGFLGLCAPALVRLISRWVPAVRRQRTFLVLSAVVGMALLLTADILLRAVFGPTQGAGIPVGIITSILGALFLIVLAHRLPRTAAGSDTLTRLRAGIRFGKKHPGWIIGSAAVVLLGVMIAGVLIGDRLVLLGDVAQWIQGVAPKSTEIVLDTRVPRVVAAALAGVCFALAGTLVQAVSRNPLAEPGILGVTAAAGLGAVFVITTVPVRSDALVFTAAIVMALMAAALLLLAAKVDQLRMILVGVGIGAGAAALTNLLIVWTDPWNQTIAITWLGGSTYGATYPMLVPAAVMVVLVVVAAFGLHRDLDLLQLDDTTPRALGVRVDGVRIVAVLLAVGLTATATAGIGVIGFVGLIAPHVARLIVGRRNALVIPLAALLGGALVVVSDMVGRAAIAPGQLPAGTVVAIVGTPVFLVLLHRMKPSVAKA